MRKPDGRQRPLGIATVEDRILQRAVVEVLNAVYEVDFLGFSYGFRLKDEFDVPVVLVFFLLPLRHVLGHREQGHAHHHEEQHHQCSHQVREGNPKRLLRLIAATAFDDDSGAEHRLPLRGKAAQSDFEFLNRRREQADGTAEFGVEVVVDL